MSTPKLLYIIYLTPISKVTRFPVTSDDGLSTGTVRRFLSGEVPVGLSLSSQSLLAMGSLLFERAIRITNLSSPSMYHELCSCPHV